MANYTKEDAIKAFQAHLDYVNRSNTTSDDVLDDGRDSNDAMQNTRFAFSTEIINMNHGHLATINIKGISDDTLSDIWRQAWNSSYTDAQGVSHPYRMDPTLPESIWNHDINYCNLMLEYLKKKL